MGAVTIPAALEPLVNPAGHKLEQVAKALHDVVCLEGREPIVSGRREGQLRRVPCGGSLEPWMPYARDVKLGHSAADIVRMLGVEPPRKLLAAES